MADRKGKFVLAALWAYLTAAGILLGYSLVGWGSIYPSLASPISGVILIYGFPFLIVSAVIWAFWKGKEQRLNVGLLRISSTVSVYAIEFALKILSRRSQTTKIELIEDLRSKTKETVVPAVFPSVLISEKDNRSVISIDGREVLPLGGISNVLNVYCKEAGDYLVYKTDEHGFHNPPGLWSLPKIDIAAVGDSFTQGACVPSEKNMIAKVREAFPRTLNMGGAGGGPLANLAEIKEYLAVKKPKVVFWDYAQNDLGRDLAREKQVPIMMKYMEKGFSQGLLNVQPKIDSTLLNYAESQMIEVVKNENALDTERFDPSLKGKIRRLALFFRIPKIRGLLIPRLGRTLPADFEMPNPEFALFEKVLAEADATVKSWNGQLVFVFLPDSKMYGFEPLLEGSMDPLEFKRRLLEIVHRVGVPIVDIDEAFRKAGGDPLNYFARVGTHLMTYYGHFNEAGYAIAGAAMVDYLKQSSLLSLDAGANK